MAIRRFASRPFTEQEELPLTAGLGLQEDDPDAPEDLGEFTQADVGTPVSDIQAQRWEEEKQIDSARIRLERATSGQDIQNFRDELIKTEFDGADPNMRNMKKVAGLEEKAAQKRFLDDIDMTADELNPAGRLKMHTIGEQARKEALGQRDKDIEDLNQAIEGKTTEQVNLAKQLAGQIQGLQEKHAAENEAAMEAITTGGKTRKADMKTLFSMRNRIAKFKTQPPDELLITHNELARALGRKEIPLSVAEEEGEGWWKKIKKWFAGEEEGKQEDVLDIL